MLCCVIVWLQYVTVHSLRSCWVLLLVVSCLSICLCVLCTAAYVSQFRRLPRHRQAVSYHSRSVLDELVTVEECARRCLLAADRPCHGFNYKPDAHYRPCTLLHATSGAGPPAVYADDTDYYQRLLGCTSLFYTVVSWNSREISRYFNCDVLTLFMPSPHW